MGENYTFGNISGPVQTGSGTQRMAGRDMFEVPRYAASDWPASLPEAVREDLEQVSSLVRQLQLSIAGREQAEQVLEEIRAMLSDQRRPDRSRLLDAFERLGRLAKSAGAVAAGGSTLIPVLARLIRWAGSLG